eukprot:TRINITY_DN4371_c0_g2_i2.p1 TRINITY_DN4371_c0_g2~~TRINITY_DN4371_c0_g2_i2.p1  ORF type:complete len:435 (-),score=115.41 TRINITY_DN4371_c0_g2_i2:1196-2500(-)
MSSIPTGQPVTYKWETQKKALEDANTSISLNKDWAKGYYRKAEALYALRRFGEIFGLINIGKKLDNELFDEIFNRTKAQLMLEQNYTKKTDPLGIHVRIIDETKGKGLFALKDIPENTVIFSEKPILTIQKTNNKESILACSHCMKFIGAIKSESLEQKLKAPYQQHCVNTIKEPYCCPKGCQEIFCSESCFKKANYHSLLCSEGKEDHPVAIFKEHCNQITYRFDLASKIIASIVLGEQSFDKMTRAPWTKISHYDTRSKKFEHEEAAENNTDFNAMKENIIRQSLELLKQTPVYNEKFPQLFTYEYYNNLLGMIDLNGANIESFPKQEVREELMRAFAVTDVHIPTSCGNGLFAIQSSINHNCKANAEAVGGLLDVSDAEIRVISLRPIKKYEEITISYIEAPNKKDVEERNKELEGGYLFKCQCNKCNSQR